MTTDFAKARKTMVDCQIEPMGVTHRGILSLFENIPRERFVPKALNAMAFVDEDLPVGGGYYIMEPAVLARLIQAAEPRQEDVALVIGDKTGYVSAILSGLIMTAVVMEAKAGDMDNARKVWAELDCCNTALVKGSPAKGSPEHAPYSLIVVAGAVAEIPDALCAQLSIGGRLVTVLRESEQAMGKASIVRRTGEAEWSRQALFDAATPFLPEFRPRPGFTF